MSNDLYDVAIVGAGPAGATAAVLLAQKGRRVVLVDRTTFPGDVARAGWLNARCAPLLAELGVTDKSLLAYPFRDVTFHREDFSQTARPTFEDAPGYLIDRAQFDNALVSAAVDQGITFIQGFRAADLLLRESSVVVELANGRRTESRLLLLASGRGTELLERVGLVMGSHEAAVWAAQVDALLRADAAPKDPYVGVFLGLDNAGSFGLCCVSPDQMSVSVSMTGEREEVIPALLRVCRQAFEHKFVPVDLSDRARSAAAIRSPASVALDMDSHVGKNVLVIGDAGGFVSAASNEGIYPAMWSARIAVDVADKALQNPCPQDELMTFDSTWRMQMADYLRSPHTDIQFLLPLIFTNQPMADRMGAAFFLGENI